MDTRPAVRAVGGEGKGKGFSVRHALCLTEPRRRTVLLLWAMVLALTLGLAPAGGTNDLPPAGILAALQADPNQPSARAPAAGDHSRAGPTNWFEAWKQLKKDLESTTGTSFSVSLDDHAQFVLNGPGEDHHRNLFWWNVTVTQKLWPDAKLVVRVRGSSNANGQTHAPPHGVYPLVRPKMNLDWMWAETNWIYVANLYLEQKLLDKKLTITLGKINAPLYFDTNNVAGWDFLSHSIAKNQILPHKYHTLGAIVRYDVADWMYVQVGAIDAQGIRSETGFNTAFHAEDWWQAMYEVGFKTAFGGKEGNYRFTLFQDPTRLSRFDHTGVQYDTLAFGVSFDQMLTDKIGAFFRYGVTDGDVRTFSNTWSLGGTVKGLLPPAPRTCWEWGSARASPPIRTKMPRTPRLQSRSSRPTTRSKSPTGAGSTPTCRSC